MLNQFHILYRCNDGTPDIQKVDLHGCNSGGDEDSKTGKGTIQVDIVQGEEITVSCEGVGGLWFEKVEV